MRRKLIDGTLNATRRGVFFRSKHPNLFLCDPTPHLCMVCDLARARALAMCCVRLRGETEAGPAAASPKVCERHFPVVLPLGGIIKESCSLGLSNVQQHLIEPPRFPAGIYVFQTPVRKLSQEQLNKPYIVHF